MLIKLTHDTSVRYPKDSILEVTDEEAKRLKAFGLAEEVKAEKKAKKNAKKGKE